MDSDDLVEDGSLDRHEGVGYFQASGEPVFRIEHVVGVAVLLFFDKSCFR